MLNGKQSITRLVYSIIEEAVFSFLLSLFLSLLNAVPPRSCRENSEESLLRYKRAVCSIYTTYLPTYLLPLTQSYSPLHVGWTSRTEREKETARWGMVRTRERNRARGREILCTYMYVYTIYVYTRPVSHPASQPSDYYRLDLIELSVRSNMRLSFHRPRRAQPTRKENQEKIMELCDLLIYLFWDVKVLFCSGNNSFWAIVRLSSFEIMFKFDIHIYMLKYI